MGYQRSHQPCQWTNHASDQAGHVHNAGDPKSAQHSTPRTRAQGTAEVYHTIWTVKASQNIAVTKICLSDTILVHQQQLFLELSQLPAVTGFDLLLFNRRCKECFSEPTPSSRPSNLGPSAGVPTPSMGALLGLCREVNKQSRRCQCFQ